MAIPVEMPKMSDTMEEGVLVAWLVEEGAAVAAGDVIAQVETDKATMDLEVYDDGVLLKRVIEEGASIPIGGLIAVLGNEGEDIGAVVAKYHGGGAAPQAPEAPAAAPSGDGAAQEPASTMVRAEGERIKASPLARKLAKEHGVDLAKVRGSGPEGRIIKRDIQAALGEVAAPVFAPPTPAPAPEPVKKPKPAPDPIAKPTATPAPDSAYEATRLSQMRKTIARRLAESKYTAPHFYLTVDVDMEKAVHFRTQLNTLAETQGRGKISFNDLITKASALALLQHPAVNASYLEKEGEIRHHKDVHVAIAVAVEEGLITPVVRHADRKGLGQIASETRDLAGRARNRQLQPEDYTGSTFTTSNLGMFGIEGFTAIINPPNACIMAIGAIRDVPVVKEGQVVPGKRMKLTLSCDHRLVDGATGAQFLATIQQYLEEPLNLLL